MRCQHKPILPSFWAEDPGQVTPREVEAIFSPHGPHAKTSGGEGQERSGSLTVLLTQQTIPRLPLDFVTWGIP